jgi:hypothetical protein
MTLVAGTGSVGKNKLVKCVLSGFAGTGTSNFGAGSDINCEDVEFLSIEKPEKSENEAEEIQTNKRLIKDDTATDAWEDWDGLEIINDEASVNWKAFVAAQETDATGTVTLTAGTNTIGSWQAKVKKAGGGGGDASGFDSSFSPTFSILKSLGTGTA